MSEQNEGFEPGFVKYQFIIIKEMRQSEVTGIIQSRSSSYGTSFTRPFKYKKSPVFEM